MGEDSFIYYIMEGLGGAGFVGGSRGDCAIFEHLFVIFEHSYVIFEQWVIPLFCSG